MKYEKLVKAMLRNPNVFQLALGNTKDILNGGNARENLINELATGDAFTREELENLSMVKWMFALLEFKEATDNTKAVLYQNEYNGDGIITYNKHGVARVSLSISVFEEFEYFMSLAEEEPKHRLLHIAEAFGGVVGFYTLGELFIVNETAWKELGEKYGKLEIDAKGNIKH